MSSLFSDGLRHSHNLFSVIIFRNPNIFQLFEHCRMRMMQGIYFFHIINYI